MLRNKGLPLMLGICALLLPVAAAGHVRSEMVVTKDTSALTARPNKLKLFGSREMKSRKVKSFNKWTSMWRRHNLPKATEEQLAQRKQTRELSCAGIARIECSREAWDKFIAEQKDVPLGDLLTAVNQYMNRTTYIVDPVNWGIPDYWATPDEFFLKDGDCEDYAISKYVTLKRLGVDPMDMRIVVLQDENLRAAHAVLAVRYEGKYMILDNQVNSVLPDTQILHYRPVYSINETGWWLHHRRRFTTN